MDIYYIYIYICPKARSANINLHHHHMCESPHVTCAWDGIPRATWCHRVRFTIFIRVDTPLARVWRQPTECVHTNTSIRGKLLLANIYFGALFRFEQVHTNRRKNPALQLYTAAVILIQNHFRTPPPPKPPL